MTEDEQVVLMWLYVCHTQQYDATSITERFRPLYELAAALDSDEYRAVARALRKKEILHAGAENYGITELGYAEIERLQLDVRVALFGDRV